MSNTNETLDVGLIKLLVAEIQSQLGYADIAAYHLDELSRSRTDSVEMTWYHIESLVSSMLSVANILWTSNSRRISRSKLLRREFGLEHVKLPKGFRDTRNALEHYDERAEDWWRTSETKNIADRNLGPKNMITGSITFARHYDPYTGELSVFGQSTNLMETYNFMKAEIQPRVS